MYGLIGSFTAQPGTRDRLVEILSQGSASLPGCLSYIIAADAADPDRVWVTEVWTDAGSHRASLELPQVRAAIALARPLVAGIGARTETRPVSGIAAAD